MGQAQFTQMVQVAEESSNGFGSDRRARVKVYLEDGGAVLCESDNGLIGDQREIVQF